MKKKNTNDLQSELTAAPNLSRFLSMNQEQFVNENFVDMLQALFQKSRDPQDRDPYRTFSKSPGHP